MRSYLSAFALLASIGGATVVSAQQSATPAPPSTPTNRTATPPATPPVQQGTAQSARPTAPTGAPKLIIAISVDQFSADLFAEYRGLFTGGLARLSNSIVFPSGYQAHGATETCPGHSVILTGNLPAHTGIIANNWFDQSLSREDKKVYCSEDPTVAGSSSRQYTPSLNYLLVPTLGDLMKQADPRTRVVSVAGKDRAALMMGGRNADELWWLTATGLASLPGRAQSPQVAQMSQAVASNVNTARPALQVPEECAARAHAVALSNGQTVGTGQFQRNAGDFRRFMASPEADGTVLALGAAFQAQMGLGRGPQTDLLIMGLSATDYVGHSTGTGGGEMCMQMLALDRELGDFFTRMDATGIDYAVVLTADHGGHDLPERNRENAAPTAERVDAALNPGALSNTLKTQLNMTDVQGPLLLGDGAFGDIYFNRSLTPAQRQRVEQAALQVWRNHPQVERVFTRAELEAVPMPRRSPELWTMAEKLRASYNPQRSGDFVVVLHARVTPISDPNMGYVATHGSVWDYDRRVPMLFMRRGLPGFEQPNPVMVADIVPTIAGLINLPIDPSKFDGRCLDLIAGEGTSCPANSATRPN